MLKRNSIKQILQKYVIEKDQDNKYTTFAYLKPNQATSRHLLLSRNASSNLAIDYQFELDAFVL